MADLKRLLAIGTIRGAVEQLQHLLGELPESDADAVVLVGDLGSPWSRAATYRAIFKTLGVSGKHAFWVPGPLDAPVRDYLRESYNMEIVYPTLRGVHGAVALGPGQVLFAGMGGDIADDPDVTRAEEAILRYPGWEVEYRLKTIRDFDEHQRVLLFTTPPAHKGLREPGSEVLAELIKTYNPRVVVVAGPRPSEERLGKTLVVCPGRFDQGEYAQIDFRGPSVELAKLAEPAAV